MDGWHRAFEYYLKLGFPENLLLNQSISQEDAEQLVRFISQRKPKIILEIGTFIGISTSTISSSISDESKVICIDPNLPIIIQSSEFNFYDDRGSIDILKEMLDHLGLVGKVIIKEGFFSCYPSKGFQNQISLFNIDISKKSIIGNSINQFSPFDMVFLDSDHYSEAVKSDLNLIHNYLSPNGEIIIHDFCGNWATQVLTGTKEFLNDHPDYELIIDGNLGFLHKRYK